MVSDDVYAAVVAENTQLRERIAQLEAALTQTLERLGELDAAKTAKEPSSLRQRQRLGADAQGAEAARGRAQPCPAARGARLGAGG